MSSFSDAHELPEIPLIAANLHALLLPRQSQIWAVLHPGDSERRLVYLLTDTFLGRMCLSGDVVGLSHRQWAIVRAAIDAYKRAAPVIKDGVSRRVGRCGESWRHPTGWQAVVRTGSTGGEVLIVAHTFGSAPSEITVSLPPGKWTVAETFPNTDDIRIVGGDLVWTTGGDFAGQVIRLVRDDAAASRAD